MNSLNRKTAWRIALVSIALAALASPIAWYFEREQTEEATVALAMEESRRLLGSFELTAPSQRDLIGQANDAARTITGGLFDIAEIYDAEGHKLAEAQTPAGQQIEERLPRHARPRVDKATYESLTLNDSTWALRVLIPLQRDDGQISGYFEGVRIVPPWQREQMLDNTLNTALLASLAALLCGAVIYPIVVHLSSENARKTREVLDSHISMMEALGRAIAKRDSDTGAHNYRVAWIASAIAEEMGFSGANMQALIAGSFLHDVGKIGIPDAILLKPGKLDEEEFRIMRTHVDQGEHIVTGMGWLDGAHAVVAGHHEKWDGSGYPRRLRGEEIPLAARIFAVADVFDALCSRRPYKEPLSLEAAMDILEQNTGTHFDPAVMAVFRRLHRQIHQQLAESSEEKARELLQQRVRQHFG